MMRVSASAIILTVARVGGRFFFRRSDVEVVPRKALIHRLPIRFPPWYLGIPLLLSIFGIILLYSTTYTGDALPSQRVVLQSVWLILGILLYFLVSRIRIGARPRSAHLFFWPIWLLLIATLFVGLAVHGSSRWIKVGPVQVQPSEFSKFFVVLLLAHLLSEYTKREEFTKFLTACVVVLAFVLPILRQPDLGTASAFVFLFLTLMFVKPLPRRYLFIVFLALLIVAIPGWFMLEDYQKARIVSFFQPSGDPLGGGYHVNQSKIAIGSGGVFGKGFLHGTQTQGQFIPVQAADFIFATLGEEWGFVGALLVLGLYLTFLLKSFSLARQVKTEYERLIVFGVLAVIFFQVFVNIGMTISLMPVTGLPLPFLSYGGSSTLTMWAFCGALASLSTPPK